MSNILLICDDYISKKMAGPGQRYVEMAKALSKNHTVSLLANFEKGFVGSQKIDILDTPIFYYFNLGVKITIANPFLARIINQYDVIIAQGGLLHSFNLFKKIKKPLVLDLYCPWFFEDLETSRSHKKKNNPKILKPVMAMLKRGDFFVCANEKQRDFYMALLMQAGRITTQIYAEDTTLRNLIDIAPSGISSRLPQHNKKVMKGVHPGIKDNDKIILWFGGLWDWVDPETVVAAIAKISKTRNEVKLVFVGIKHPDPNKIPPKKVKKIIELSKSLNLYNKSIFFIDWIPFEERENYLLESDLGIVAHTQTLETRYSWRIKILDFFWTTLPVIASNGDSMAEIIKSHNLGRIVPVSKPEATAHAILELLDNPQEYQKVKNNIKNFTPSLYWDNLIVPLDRFCQEPRRNV